MSEIRINRPNPRRATKPTGLKLYHGTSAEHVPGIIENGLSPRSITRQDNFGSQGLPSIADHVYLGLQEFMFYSVVASHHLQEQYRMAVVEIDLDKLDFEKLFPNEDAIWSTLRQEGYPEFESMHRVPAIRKCLESVEMNRDFWYELLLTQASVAHKGTIPTTAISRISIFELNLILTDLFYQRQSTAAETTVVFKTLDNSSYDALRKWLFRGQISRGALEHMKTDALGKGYALPNLATWSAEFEKMVKNPPFVVEPGRLNRDDTRTIGRLARSLINYFRNLSG